jgi:AcrR family transcriptional regulator
MTSVKKTKKNPEAPRLTRDDWLNAAFDAVAEGGFDKVRVLVIAEKLGVTRGSFYWHFTDHADLITAVLTRWRDREVVRYETLPSGAALDPQTELGHLLDAAMTHASGDIKNIRFELALRGLARRDPVVEKILIDVDQMRLGMIEQKFRRLIPDPVIASELSALFYLALVGSQQALSRPSSTPRLKEYLKQIIAEHLIHRQ